MKGQPTSKKRPPAKKVYVDSEGVNWTLGKKLGEGNTGRVFVCDSSQQRACIKLPIIIDSKLPEAKLVAALIRRRVRNRYLVQFLAHAASGPGDFKESHRNFAPDWYVMEILPQAIVEPRTLADWTMLRNHIRKGLQSIHECGFIHGDLKLDNVCRRDDDYVLIDPICIQNSFTNTLFFKGNLQNASTMYLRGAKIEPLMDDESLGWMILNNAVSPQYRSESKVPTPSEGREIAMSRQLIVSKTFNTPIGRMAADIIKNAIRHLTK